MRLFLSNDGTRVASTTKARSVLETKELMRSWELTFDVPNLESFRKHINKTSVFELEGQQFEVFSFQSNSGINNLTSVQATHVSYGLNEYEIPPEYSHLGTLREIVVNLFETSGANEKFSVGDIPETEAIAFNLGNEQETSIRSALLGLQKIGAEVSFDNYTTNLYERIGTATGKTFEFGKDLVSFNRSWSKHDGSTYEINMAVLQRLPNSDDEYDFELGDDVTVRDDILEETVTKRIVKYVKCHDDPAQDSLTLGVFIRDSATNALEMQADIDVNLVEGKPYNSVAINRTDGFVSTRDDGRVRVKMNGTDGFVAQAKENDIWVDKAWLDTDGLAVNKITTADSRVHGVVGGTSLGGGFTLYHEDEKFFSVFTYKGGGFSLRDGHDVTALSSMDDYTNLRHNGKNIVYGADDATQLSYNGAPIVHGARDTTRLSYNGTSIVYGNSATTVVQYRGQGRVIVDGSESTLASPDGNSYVTVTNSEIAIVKNGVQVQKW